MRHITVNVFCLVFFFLMNGEAFYPPLAIRVLDLWFGRFHE